MYIYDQRSQLFIESQWRVTSTGRVDLLVLQFSTPAFTFLVGGS
jgi:hypothetical protein